MAAVKLCGESGHLVRTRDTIHYRLKRRVASLFLDLAEKLPSSNVTILSTLQHIRNRQRKAAAKELARSKPPIGTGFKYSGLRLFELFPIEDYERMEDGLKSLFSEGRDVGETLHNFGEASKSLAGSNCSLIGYLISKQTGLGFGFNTRVLETLPAEVKYISITLHRILPSAFVVCLDITLGSSVSEKLQSLESQPFLPEVTFRRWIPRGPAGGGYSRSSAEVVRQEAVLASLSELQERVEHALIPYINGYFSTEEGSRSPRLPAIQTFSLDGVPTDDKGFQTWLSDAEGYLRILGADSLHREFSGFKKEDVVFLLKRDGYTVNLTYSAFLIGVRDNDLAIKEFLDTTLPSLALLEFLFRAGRNIEHLRRIVYKRLTGRNHFDRVRADFRINQQLQRESMLLSRFEIELGMEREFLEDSQRPLELFLSMSQRRADKNLSQILIESVQYRFQLIGKHLTLASELFSKHLSWRNLDANYSLQRRILFWTIVVTLAAVFSLLQPYWAQIMSFFVD